MDDDWGYPYFRKPPCFTMNYPLVICYIAIESGPVEIVELPIENGDVP